MWSLLLLVSPKPLRWLAVSDPFVPVDLVQLTNWIDYDLLGNYHTSELPFVFANEVGRRGVS